MKYYVFMPFETLNSFINERKILDLNHEYLRLQGVLFLVYTRELDEQLLQNQEQCVFFFILKLVSSSATLVRLF